MAGVVVGGVGPKRDLCGLIGNQTLKRFAVSDCQYRPFYGTLVAEIILIVVRHDASFKKVPAAFYRSPMGAEPVRDWIKSLPVDDRKIIGADIQTVEFGWPIGMPLCRSLGDGLWEVRSSITGGIARMIFFMHDGKLMIVNGFVKKTQKTPGTEIELAKKRKKEVET